jgi:hypothetical protein
LTWRAAASTDAALLVGNDAATKAERLKKPLIFSSLPRNLQTFNRIATDFRGKPLGGPQ